MSCLEQIHDKLEELIQLHEEVTIVWNADRYVVELSHDGNDPTITIEGETLTECFEILSQFTTEQVRNMFWEGHKTGKKFPLITIVGESLK
jgi:hypothetical protein